MDTEAPADPNQRKADLLSCPRWVISSLQNERVARRELEKRLQEAHDTGNSDLLLRENQNLRAQIQEFQAQQQRQKSQNESIKKYMVSKEEEFQTVCKEKQQLQEKYDSLEQSTLEKAAKWREIAAVLPQKHAEIDKLTAEVEKWKNKAKDFEDCQQKNDSQIQEINILEENFKKEKNRLTEKLQEVVLRCQDMQEQIRKREDIVQKRDTEMKKLSEYIKSMQERKAKSDEGVRKLVEQKQNALNKAVEQINVLKSQLRKSNRRQSVEIARQSLNLKSPVESPRASTRMVPISQPPKIIWEIQPKADPDAVQLNTFDFSRKLSKSTLPPVYDSPHALSIPDPIFKEIVSSLYLEPLLVREDLELFKKTCDLFEEDHAEKLSTAIIYLFEYSNPLLCLELMKYYTKIEVSRTVDVNTLFRGNSLAAKILSKYSRVVGAHYLVNVLTPIIDNISPNCNFEVDPDRFEPGTQVNEEQNQAAVCVLAQEFLDAIIESLPSMPLQFRVFTFFLKEAVSEKFPENPYFGVVNFLFLRFFCVAIAAPLSFEIKSPHILEPNVKRGMLLASKLLQTLANGARLKEKYMIPFNKWLEDTTPKLHSYFEQLTKTQPKLQIELFSKPKFAKTKEEATNLLQEIIQTKKQEFLEYIPSTYNQKQKGYVRLSALPLLKTFTDALQDQISQKTFQENHFLIKPFIQLLTCENAIMSSIAEKLDSLLGFRQKEPYILAFLELFAYFHHPEKLPSLVNFWVEIEVDHHGSLEPTMIASRMITRFVQSYSGNVFHYFLADLIDPLLTHRVYLEIDEDRMTENQLLSRGEDTKALIRICEDFKTGIINRLSKLPMYFLSFLFLFPFVNYSFFVF